MKKFPAKFWFTSETPLPCFGNDSLFNFVPVTNNPSRKEFLGKFLGVAALPVALAERRAKATEAGAGGDEANSKLKSALPFAVRSDHRTVARRVAAV